MSNEPVLSEFLTKEELAEQLLRNPRTLDRWAVLGTCRRPDQAKPTSASCDSIGRPDRPSSIVAPIRNH